MLQDIVGTLRQVGRSYPRIWRFTEPIRAITLQAFWDVRNLITRGRPLVIPVNSSLSVLFYPTGQVAKALWSNDFEARERDFVAYFVRSGMTVLNAGANSGLYCILLSALVGTSGHVYAFEPSSENCTRLKQNLALNGAGRAFRFLRNRLIAIRPLRCALRRAPFPRSQPLRYRCPWTACAVHDVRSLLA